MVPSDGDKAAPKSLVEAENRSSIDNQSTPLLTSSGKSPGASAASQAVSGARPTRTIQRGGLKHTDSNAPQKEDGPLANGSPRAPSKEDGHMAGIEELQQSIREKVEQILAKSCEQAVESIMQATAASFQQATSPNKPTPGERPNVEIAGNGKHVGWKGVPKQASTNPETVERPVPEVLGAGSTDEIDAEVLEVWECCHSCGNKYKPDAKFCRACGVMRINFPPEEKWISCPSCGNLYHPDSKFCRKCGARREHFPQAPPKGGKRGWKGRRSALNRRMSGDVGGVEQELIQEKPRGIFANSDDMKRQLREAIAQPDYDVSRFYWEAGCCQAIARSTIFDNVTLVVIAANAIWISIDCDFNTATVLAEADPVFQVVDNLFCFYFVFEWAVRFGSFRRKKDCLKDAWFVFDSMLAAIMALETWVMTLLILAFSRGSGDGGMGDASLLKVVRLVRLVRMARVIRILNALPELMVLIKGMFVATRAVSCTVALMLIIIYIFAVVFRQLTSDSAFGKRRFPDVPRTMRYLLLQSTVPDLYDAATEIWEEGWMYALLFLFFLLVVAITVMNMLVGVLVGVVNTVASVEKEQLMVNFVKTNLLALLRSLAIDRDDDGQINLAEFKALIEIPEAIRSFDSMGVDVVGLVDLSDFIFKDGRAIPFADFMELVMQLRGTNQATVKDIVDLRKFILIEHKRLERMMSQAKGEASMALGKMGWGKDARNMTLELTQGDQIANGVPEPDHGSPFIVTKDTCTMFVETPADPESTGKKLKTIKKPGEKKPGKHSSNMPEKD